MGLEAVTYIDDLVPAWPLGTDYRREGDDHLRAIKTAIKNTFPSINGAVTVSQDVLNAVPANLTAIIAEALDHLTPLGIIAMWGGGAAPAGWSLCDGSTVSGYGVVPDLRDKFIISAGPLHPLNTTGGNASPTTAAAGAHAHGGNTADTTLTEAQMPQHNHDYLGAGVASNVANGGGKGFDLGVASSIQTNLPSGAVSAGQAFIQDAGSSQPHSHGISSQADHTHTVDVTPPYYALAYIIKTSAYVAP